MRVQLSENTIALALPAFNLKMPQAPAGLIVHKRLFASYLGFSKMNASGRECPVPAWYLLRGL
jgi:hypothetical protein